MSFHPHLIEIDGGILRSTTIHGVGAPRASYVGIGEYHFFVDLVEEDGGRIGLWSGFDYSTAINEAEHARRDFEIEQPVVDRIGGVS